MVHKHIAIKDTMKNTPDAKAAVDEAWDKLKHQLTWDVKKVEPKSAEVVQQAKKDGRKILFASLMAAISKHFELAKHPTNMQGKSRAPGEDNVEDDSAHRAVSMEQRASIPQLAAARFLETLSKTPWRGESSQRRSISLHAGAHFRSTQIVTTAGEPMPTSVDQTSETMGPD